MLIFQIKKITLNNFIISIRNIMINYEIKKDSLIRRDFETKSLISYAKTIKKSNYKWLDYSTFENLEKKVITEYNNNSDINVVNEIINSINNLNIENKLSEDNNEKYDTESKKYKDIKSSGC